MTHDPSSDRPDHEGHSPWASPADPSAQPGGYPGPSDPVSGATGYPSPYGPASPWETAGTAAGAMPYGYPAQRRTNTMAIVAMVLSLVGLVTCITAPVGAILGHVARRQLRQSGEEGDGFALTAIIAGWAITAITVIGCGLYAAVIGFAISQDGNF